MRICRTGCLILVHLMVTACVIRGEQSAGDLVIARVKYGGGGDWYNDPSSIPNLARYVRRHTGLAVREQERPVSLMDESLFSFPFLFLTGHGRITLTDGEIGRLRKYLLGGGFLYADDDYGLDPHFRSVMKQVFPGRDLQELPFSHELYRIHFHFQNGLPKIHEHDAKPPRGFGLFDDTGRLMVFYTYETNLSDGWADPEVHENTPEKRDAALRMGTNILVFAMLH